MSSCGRWCTARSWQRCAFGHALFRKGEEGNSFHIIAQGEVEVYRDGQRVAQLGAGTSVGEMAYLAPSPDLRVHSADMLVTDAGDDDLVHARQRWSSLGPEHAAPVRRRLHPRAGAPAARRARAAGPPAAHPVAHPVAPAGRRIAPASPCMKTCVAAIAASLLMLGAAHAADPTPAQKAQQDRMAQCNKDAEGKTGDARKAFMKTCLSAKKPTPQQAKMKACNADAAGKTGDDRKAFMKNARQRGPTSRRLRSRRSRARSSPAPPRPAP